MSTEIIVRKRGRITIPSWISKKYGTDLEGSLKMVETKEGIVLLPKSSLWVSFWDLIDTQPSLTSQTSTK